MKICHVINSLGTGGAEKLIVNTAYEMQRLGHEVLIITLFHDEGYPMELARKHNLKVVNLGNKKVSLLSYIKLFQLLRKFDVVHSHLFPAIYYTSFSPLKIKKFMTEHSTHNKRRDKKKWFLLERIMYNNFTKVFCISNATKKNLETWQPFIQNKQKAMVISNGIENTFFEEIKNKRTIKKLQSNGKVKLLCVGSFTPHKNHILLIQAMKQIPNAKLFLVGDGPMKNNIIQEVKKHNLTNRVELLGVRSDVKELMRESDILILPSQWEGFGLVIVEAMASELPVVASNIEGINEIIEDNYNGILMNQKNPLDIAESVNLLIRNEELRRKLILNGKMTAGKYKVTKTAADLIEAYRL